MDCAKSVKIYAKNVKWGMEGCGKKGKWHILFLVRLQHALPLVNLTSSICCYPGEGQLVYATRSEELPCRTEGCW